MTSASLDRQTTAAGRLATNAGYPIARPLAATVAASSSLAEDQSGRVGAANDGAHRGTPSSVRRRMRATDVAALAAQLSDRDKAILQSVAEHQFLTGRQIAALHFDGHAATSGPRIARRVLARLRGLRLLGTLERRIGGLRAGSDGLIHYLDVLGDRLLRGQTGRAARRTREPSARFVAHRLAVADTHLALLQAHRRGTIDLVDSTVEPAAWRR